MAGVDSTVAQQPWWARHLRGHLFLFDRHPAPAHSAGSGVRLLLAAALLEALRLADQRWFHPGLPLWLKLPALLGIGLVAVPGIAGLKLSQIGFRPWRAWTATEKSYFLQVIVIANLVFPIVLASPMRNRFAQPDVATSLWSVFVPYLFFGFYQELVYRGMAQLELVRRWGAPVGILVANVLYTFGPLHWYYFASRSSLAIPMFASIFAMGLFFGALYQRSGNLWMVAVFHAIGNAYILWSVGPVQ